MKKISNILLLVPFLLFALSSCEIDNYEAPNASFAGSIIDATTKELVETELQNGSQIRAYELGWETMSAQTWVIMNDGQFRNDMVFAATYDFEFTDCNFYPFYVESFEIKKGVNTHNFEVTPYIRVKNASITHDSSNNRIVATFNIEGGKPEVKVNSVRLYAFTDMHVGEQVKFELKGDNFQQSFSPSKEIDSTTYTLSIDLNENKEAFKYSRSYYFRIGALADVAGVETIRHNYAPLVVIAL